MLDKEVGERAEIDRARSSGRSSGQVGDPRIAAGSRWLLTAMICALLGTSGCSMFDAEPPKVRPPVRTTPRVSSFPTAAAAKAGCAGDGVVWGDSESSTFRLQGDPLFGRTHYGAYLCMQTALTGGYHPATGAGPATAPSVSSP